MVRAALGTAACVGGIAGGLLGLATPAGAQQWTSARPPATLDAALPVAPLTASVVPGGEATGASRFQAVSAVSQAQVPSFTGPLSPARPLGWRTSGMVTSNAGTIRLTAADEPVATSAAGTIRQTGWADRTTGAGPSQAAPTADAYADPFGDRTIRQVQATAPAAGSDWQVPLDGARPTPAVRPIPAHINGPDRPTTLPGGAFIPAPLPPAASIRSASAFDEPPGPPPVVIAPAAEWTEVREPAPVPAGGGASLLIAPPGNADESVWLVQDGVGPSARPGGPSAPAGPAAADPATAPGIGGVGPLGDTPSTPGPVTPNREEAIPSVTPPEIANPDRDGRGAAPMTPRSGGTAPAADPLQPGERPRPLPPGPSSSRETDPGLTEDDLLPPGRERLSDEEIDQELERLRERLRQRQNNLDRESADRSANPTDPCADQADRCARATNYLLRSRITDIVLDTTPSFRVQPLQTAQVTESLTEALAKEPFRPWIGVGGTSIVEGRLADYRLGQIYIQSSQGGLSTIPWTSLSDADRCYVAGVWGIPAECRLPSEVYATRCWTPMTFAWTASALCHKPLYFEDVQLERYGHSAGPIAQPFLSTAHFFGNIAILPYKMGIHPPNECQYALGYYRPGSCAPYMIEPFPLSLRGALYQTAFVAGLITLLP